MSGINVQLVLELVDRMTGPMKKASAAMSALAKNAQRVGKTTGADKLSGGMKKVSADARSAASAVNRAVQASRAEASASNAAASALNKHAQAEKRLAALSRARAKMQARDGGGRFVGGFGYGGIDAAGMGAASMAAFGGARALMYSAPVVAAGAAAYTATKQAIDFESAMANVSKVVEGTPDEIAAMRQEVLNLTKILPMSAVEVAKLYEAGGQAGLARDQLTGFAEDAAKVSTAFQMSAEDAGEAMARMRVIFGLNREGVQKLNDTINVLGNNTNARERDILSVLQRVGAAGKNVGLTAENTSALAAAMLSTGTAENVVATGLSSLFSKLGAAGGLSDKAIEAMEKIGLSAEKLQRDMTIDPNLTIMQVLEKINSLPQIDKVNALVDIFGLEYQDDVARLAQVYPELAKNFAMAGNSYMMFRQAVAGTKGLEDAADETDKLYSTLKQAGKDKRVSGVLKELGFDAKDFGKLLEEDAGKAMSLFLMQLDKSGKAGQHLKRLNFRESADELQRLARHAQAVKDAFEAARRSLGINGSMDREFQKRMATTEAQLKLFSSQIERIGINLGDKALPALNKVVKGVSEALDGAGLGEGENRAATWFDRLGAAMDGFAKGVGAQDFNAMMRDIGAAMAGLNQNAANLDAGDVLGQTFAEWQRKAQALKDLVADVKEIWNTVTFQKDDEPLAEKLARRERQLQTAQDNHRIASQPGGDPITAAIAGVQIENRTAEIRELEARLAAERAKNARPDANGIRTVPTTTEPGVNGYRTDGFVRPHGGRQANFGTNTIGPVSPGALSGSSDATFAPFVAGAERAGEQVKQALNVTASPQVDASSIDAFIAKVERARSALAGLNSEAARAGSGFRVPGQAAPAQRTFRPGALLQDEGGN